MAGTSEIWHGPGERGSLRRSDTSIGISDVAQLEDYCIHSRCGHLTKLELDPKTRQEAQCERCQRFFPVSEFRWAKTGEKVEP